MGQPQKKKGSILGRLISSRNEQPETPQPIAPAPVAAVPRAPAATPPSAPPRGPQGVVGSPDSSADPTSTPAPRALKRSRPKVKRSITIKAANFEAIQALSWFWESNDSAVIDLAIDALTKSNASELSQARELLRVKGRQQPKV